MNTFPIYKSFVDREGAMKITDRFYLALVMLLLFSSFLYASSCSTYNCHVIKLNGEFVKNGPHTFYRSDGVDISPCAPCHKPHNAGSKIPLWNDTNQYDDGSPYKAYSSPTGTLDNLQDTNISSPSEACMGCHDGMSESTGFTGGYFETYSMGVLTIDYSKSNHPIGVVYDYTKDSGLNNNVANGWVNGTNGKFKLINNKVECLTCHDPHKGAIGYSFTDRRDIEKLLRTTDVKTFCSECHTNK
ncbi:multiheme c-type cytochrome [Deferribacter desulfuricans SSM1]|uniref:Multiheme c-type cytochrome n=2 Tax=Deferribacter TaxID=53572 RepID=D3PCB0_DEFDS|nr:multiheme c-type cytochrome [Deferribacter desulfuricans SSM1]